MDEETIYCATCSNSFDTTINFSWEEVWYDWVLARQEYDEHVLFQLEVNGVAMPYFKGSL